MRSSISYGERSTGNIMLYGGIEAGGTKIVCAVGTGPEDLQAQISFPTTTSGETLTRIIAFFQQRQLVAPLAAIGIGSFGPISPDRFAPDYGYITTNPKPGWAQTDIVGTIERGRGVPAGFDAHVNGAALGEKRWGFSPGR